MLAKSHPQPRSTSHIPLSQPLRQSLEAENQKALGRKIIQVKIDRISPRPQKEAQNRKIPLSPVPKDSLLMQKFPSKVHTLESLVATVAMVLTDATPTKQQHPPGQASRSSTHPLAPHRPRPAPRRPVKATRAAGSSA